MTQATLAKSPPALQFAGGPRRNTEPYQSITVTPASPTIGAEIGNIDLTRPFTDLQVRELHRAFTENLVLFFRDQKLLTFEQHKALARQFGEHSHQRQIAQVEACISAAGETAEGAIHRSIREPYRHAHVRSHRYVEGGGQFSGGSVLLSIVNEFRHAAIHHSLAIRLFQRIAASYL